MTTPSQILLIPGASGSTAFWEPLAGLITCEVPKSIVGYPGFGDVASSPDVTSFEELVRSVVQSIDRPTAIIAQSMGGIIALRAALEKSDLVTHLVLSVTSGGLDVAGLGGCGPLQPRCRWAKTARITSKRATTCGP